MLHDIGHGPFSHALEPVLETESPLGGSLEASTWRGELKRAREALNETFELNKIPSTSETIAVAMVLSKSMHKVLSSDKIVTERGLEGRALQAAIAASIIGAVSGPGASHLCSLISSQIDADRLDYLTRDAHHAGLQIGFDTDRLLAKLEVLRVREENLDPGAIDLQERAAASPEGTFLQVGIAASGFGSFEQMLIGRTFLYDRLYHHHKVRAAEAMAQRSILVAERDRGSRFSLSEIFIGVDDETLLRIFSGEVTHAQLRVSSPAAAGLATGILDRDLLHRAYAFRGRFISMPPGMKPDAAEQTQNMLWGRIAKQLDNLGARYKLGQEIYELARACASEIGKGGIDTADMDRYGSSLDDIGPEQIIVDLTNSKTETIGILARYPNGAIRVPEFSFNPQKWADAYDLQKRTGYVFCPREVAPIIGLASKIVFLEQFGVQMSEPADGYIKAKAAEPSWLPPLVAAGLIDDEVAELLTRRRFSLLSVKAEDLHVPAGWIRDDLDLATRLSVQLGRHLRGGLTAEHLKSLGRVLGALFAFVDTWFRSKRVSQDLADEGELQRSLREALEYQGLSVVEKAAASGGELDLFVEDAITVENKFYAKPSRPERLAAAAGMQGRRYAVALDSQIVIVVLGHRVHPSQMLNKPSTVSVRPISCLDANRVEIRFSLPYGADVPSAEKAEAK